MDMAAVEISDFVGVFITWTTYGTWLPGDARGWRDSRRGPQLPDMQLELEARTKMKFTEVRLRPHDRVTVEKAIRSHCHHRGWVLHAVNARSNHVHCVVSGNENPQTIRDQLKANCTAQLRSQPNPLIVERTWTQKGDCAVLFTDDELDNAVRYTVEAQD
jgi:REP element-mobilizing transposase RayT